MDISSLYQIYKKSGTVSIDTRNMLPGALFLALRGPHFNANEFAHEALAKGASYAVVDEAKWVSGDRYILVENCLSALQRLAMHHRKQLAIPIIAITGSNGKTTTKELITAILQKKYSVQATAGNLNNHIGVPLTLLSMDATTAIGVVEMGANHVGEIATLCQIAAPTHGAITNIGDAHIGNFGGIDGIIRAKGELYQYLKDKEHAVWVNMRSNILMGLSEQLRHPMFYPTQDGRCRCELIEGDPFLRVRIDQNREVATHLTGAYNFENVALALCVGAFFEVRSADIADALETYTPRDMRSQVVVQGSNRVILDAYNANPTSMKAAIQNLCQIKANRKVAILGDMYELGEDSDAYHTELIRLLRTCGIKEVYVCGETFYKVSKGHGVHAFTSVDKLKQHLKQHPIVQATILIKASRGMGLESVLTTI